MSPTLQLAIAAVTAGLPTLTVLVSLLINNQRLTDFERRMDQRFLDMNQRFSDTNHRIESAKETLRAEMYRMEQVLDARLKHLEEATRA